MSDSLDSHLPKIEILASTSWKDYELLDSGNGQKLERFGPYTIVRPEPQAVWEPALPSKIWASAQATFESSNAENGGRFQMKSGLEPRWLMQYRDLKFYGLISGSRHLGVFPEQAVQWDWIADQVTKSTRNLKVLNLFGYTGIASLAAAKAGAQVTHVDASRKVLTIARDNQSLSRLDNLPIRWIVDDALKFVEREVRRQSRYDGLILDPPKFGRGPKGEVWEFYRLLPTLLQEIQKLLNPHPTFIVITAYAIQSSSLTLYYVLNDLMAGYSGKLSTGELVTIEKSAGRVISNAIFVRWSGL
jgi:23S rRNA (cytosine1962-C5)-methyltransferase